MDASGMYRKGFHPIHLDYVSDHSRLAWPTPRMDALPAVKYYFIDFGISVQMSDGLSSRKVLGIDGIDREVPELSLTRPYDPFKVDIFLIGNILRRKIHDVRGS